MAGGIISFDPGFKGGMAAWDESGILYAIPMPRSGEGIDEREIAQLIACQCPTLVVIERVGNMLAEDETGERTVKNGASAMFSFGMGYGILRGIARSYQVMSESAGRQVLIDYPLPQSWKKVVIPGATRGKAGAIAYCKKHFPEVSLIPKGCRVEHTGIADSLCLLRYGQKVLDRSRKVKAA